MIFELIYYFLTSPISQYITLTVQASTYPTTRRNAVLLIYYQKMPMIKGQANKNGLVFTISSCVTGREGRGTKTRRTTAPKPTRTVCMYIAVTGCWGSGLSSDKKVFANRLGDTFVFGKGELGAVRYLRQCSDGDDCKFHPHFTCSATWLVGSAGWSKTHVALSTKRRSSNILQRLAGLSVPRGNMKANVTGLRCEFLTFQNSNSFEL